ncbi:MAG: hypothetical protein JOY83_07045 [Alphaproteobacteria bacterium]|nr:hypothetical protein [Alphaproteobacteria bacterium]
MRLVVIAVLAAVTLALRLTHTVGPAAAPIVELPASEASPASEPSPGAKAKASRAQPVDPETVIDVAPQSDSFGGWFDGRELKLGTGDDKSDMFVDPMACVYPDAFLRSLAGGRDDCGFLRPGEGESETLTLPFLTLSAWVLVICAVATLHHFHRNWQVRRWLQRMGAQGLVASGASSRRPPHRRRRRSSRQGRAGSRGYAG